MKKYCIAYLSYFDNVLTQEVVETDATEVRDVLYDYLADKGYQDMEKLSYGELVYMVNNGDANVSVIKI